MHLDTYVRAMAKREADTLEAFLLEYFGSYEIAVRQAPYYVLEYSPAKHEVGESAAVSKQTITIRKKTQRELAGELYYLRGSSTISDFEFVRAVAHLRKPIHGMDAWYWVNVDELAEYFVIHRNRITSKMRRLIKRGLIYGCNCGCRGDVELSALGEELLRSRNNGFKERLGSHDCMGDDWR